MGEWYEVDESLPLLTEDESNKLKLKIRDVFLNLIWDQTKNRTCGTTFRVPLSANKIPTPPKTYTNIWFPDDAVEDFKTCDDFVIFLSVMPSVEDRLSHANILFIRKSDKKIFWIEPQFSSDYQYAPLVLPFINAIRSRIGAGDEYTLVHPEGTCIQAVAKDKNCVFWSMLLHTLIVGNNANTTEEATKIILAKFPTEDKLREFIEKRKSMAYHQYLKPKTDPSVAGKRHSPWVLSTGSQRQSRHRKTRRRHRPSKSSSRHSKSAKHMRKRASRRSN